MTCGLRHGARLILTARSKGALDGVAAECAALGADGPAFVAPLDLSRGADALLREAKTVAAEAFGGGGVDVLINCAGLSSRSAVLETELGTDQHLMAVNFFAAVALTKAVLPAMVARRRGTVCVVSSVQGRSGHAGWGGWPTPGRNS